MIDIENEDYRITNPLTFPRFMQCKKVDGLIFVYVDGGELKGVAFPDGKTLYTWDNVGDMLESCYDVTGSFSINQL